MACNCTHWRPVIQQLNNFIIQSQTAAKYLSNLGVCQGKEVCDEYEMFVCLQQGRRKLIRNLIIQI